MLPNMLRLNSLILLLAGAIWAIAPAHGADGRIIKVLPHLLDKEGRHTPAPSLYERDAYQAWLRKHPDEVSSLRFDVQWKSPVKSPDLKLRLEVRGTKLDLNKALVIEQPLKKSWRLSQWSALSLTREQFQAAGEVISWRASLWEGATFVAEQKSFLW